MTEPLWENAGYIGLFVDPYVTATELEGGHMVTALSFLHNLLKRLAERPRLEFREQVLRLEKVFQSSLEVATHVLKAQKPEDLVPLLQQWVARIAELPPGEVLLVPGGWRGTSNGWIVYLIERMHDGTFAVSVSNRGPSGGQYHPTKVFPETGRHQKVKSQATIRIENIPEARVTDAGFWTMVFAQWVPNPSEYHRAEVVYDVLLPWLAGASGTERLTSKLCHASSASWRTPCKSNTASAKSLLEALRFLGRSWGLSEANAKRLSVLLRREALLFASEDLVTRTSLASVEAQEAVQFLQEAGVVVPPRLQWSRLHPVTRTLNCKVVVLFFSVPGQMSDAIDKRLDHLTTHIWNKHGGGSLKVIECPLQTGGPTRQWPSCEHAALLAQDYGVRKEGTEPQDVVLFFQEDGQLITKEGIQILARDPHGSGFPWRVAGLADKDVRLLRWGCGGLVRAAIKQNMQAEQGKVALAVDALVTAADQKDKKQGLPPLWKLPASVDEQILFSRGEMLTRCSVEDWAGDPEELQVPRSVDLCDIPQSVSSANEAAKALAKAVELAKMNVKRSREAAITQRLALELETIAFIGSIFLDLIPMPVLGGSGIWHQGFIAGEAPVAEIQKQTLHAVVQLASLYAHCWQNVEYPTRAMDSERSLVAACMMCIFDVVARMRTPNSSILLPELLREDGGYSVGLGMCSNQRPLAEVFERMELTEPHWLLVRRNVLAYLTWWEKNTEKHIFDYRQPTQFEVRKYSSTLMLLRKVLERKGLELVPRDGPPMSEMEALMEYLFGRFGRLGNICPELYWLRDLTLLFKFLCTMETRNAELLRKRKDVNEYQFWRLTFDTDTAMRPMGMGWHDDVPSIFWEVQGVRGADQDIADVSASAFGREISLGEGLVVQSPADVGQMVERPSPTEDDILHTDKLPNFQDTLSPEESESLLSFLTVPYLQIPLILDLFATQDRATYLFNPTLQRLLRAVLFEPRSYQEPQSTVVSQVPVRSVQSGIFDEKTDAEVTFGTPCGILLSELAHCPSAILQPLQAIFESTAELAKAEVYSSEASYLLFMMELAVDVLAFVRFVADTLGQPARPDWIGNVTHDASSVLEHGQVFLQDFVARMGEMVSSWEKQANTRNDTVTSCVVHSYVALEKLSTNVRVEAMASWSFVRTWHSFGSVVEHVDADMSPNERLRRFLQAQGIDTKKTSDLILDQFTREEGRFRPVFLRIGQQTIRVPTFRKRPKEGPLKDSQPPGSVPEGRIFRLIQKHRRTLVRGFADAPREALKKVANVALRSDFDPGRWTQKSPGVFVAGELQLNVMTAEILWRESGLKPLPDSMTRFEDFDTIFGGSSLQCGVVSRTKHRLWVHIVGHDFDLMEWDPSSQNAFKQGVCPVSQVQSGSTAAQFCRACGRVGKCWTCDRCTMINCDSTSAHCSTCGSQRTKEDDDDEAPGLQRIDMFFGRQRKPKVKPVKECLYNGQCFKRVLELYKEEPPEVPETEQWALDLLLPILETLFPPEPEDARLRYQLLLPEAPLDEGASEMVILGFDQGADPDKKDGGMPMATAKEDENKAATWKEIVVSRVHEAVTVFNWIPHGRRLYRSVVFCSKFESSLHNLPLDSPDAQKLRGAAGSFASMRSQEGSLCVVRKNKTLKICEQYVSPRLLRGIVPSAMLEAYSFWEGEDGLIRGVPNNEQSPYFAKKLQLILEGTAPVKFVIQRLAGDFAKPQGDFKGFARPDVVVAAAKPSVQFREVDILQLMELGFSYGACQLALEKCLGDTAGAAGWLFDESNSMAIMAADTQSTPMAVDADDELQRALLMSMEGQEDDGSAAMKVDETGPEDVRSSVVECALVDLQGVKIGSDLAHLTKLLNRLEDLSHILVWASNTNGGADVAVQNITSIELPRLKLMLVPQDGGLLVKDSGGWVVKAELTESTVEGAALDGLLRGLHQTLILENPSRDLQVLVPNHDVSRPAFKGDPFTTSLVFNRSSFGWQEVMDSPYYLYPVHTTLSFLQPKNLASTLYLALLRLMSRQYKQAFVLLEGCWTDTPLLAEEQWVFNQFGGTLEDGHPDAHAVRCKLALCTAFVEDVTLPFELHLEVDHYLAKRHHVTLDLRLLEEEELQLLRLCKSATPRDRARLEYLSAHARGQSKATLRLGAAQHGGQPWSKLCSQSLQVLAQATRITRLQFKHPALGDGNPDREWPDDVDEQVLMKLIWEDTLLQDDESGVNRQLGFMFLYMALSGQMSLKMLGKDVTSSLGQLLLRVFHLKHARWGKEIVEDGESEVKPSRQMAMLALMARGTYATWPQVPSTVQVRRALAAGMNLYDAQGRESPIKFWLDAVDQTFSVTLASVGIPATDPVNLDDWAPPVEITISEDQDKCARHQPHDDQCQRREAPAEHGDTDFSKEVLSDLDFARFIQKEPSTEKASSTLPFNLHGHNSTRTAVAKDLLERLAGDCKAYAERTNSEMPLVVCGLRQSEISKIAHQDSSSCKNDILSELEQLHQCLLQLSTRDSTQLQGKISAVLKSANTMTGPHDAVFDFRLRRDLCRLESSLSFEYLTTCLLSTVGPGDLQAVNPHVADASSLLDAASAVALLAGRLHLTNRAAQQCQQLAALICNASTPKLGSEMKVDAEIATLTQLSAALGETLTTCRCYFEIAEKQCFDPRFLVFEYLQKIVLRPRQVEMVNWFLESWRQGLSRVQQMIMGAGKTTVVGPLLSMMLASREVMVTQVMPSPLLDQTRQILRSCFSAVVPKRIVTFQFDRQVEDCAETVMKIYTKLEACRKACGVVCSTPEAIKSMLLKFIEQLNALASFDFAELAPGSSVRTNRELVRTRDTLAKRSEMSDAVVRVVQLWRTGVVIMDEVDVLLHPLKSELNFPIGFREPIDLSGHRWDLPIHIIDATFFASVDAKLSDCDPLGTVSTEVEANEDHPGHKILAELQRGIQQGFAQHSLQRMPHVVLLDMEFYHAVLKQPYTSWVLLWLKRNFVGQCTVPDDILMQYMQADLKTSQQWKGTLENGLTPFSLKLLNFASNWIRAILPHILSKIDRVSYGLLDGKQLKTVDSKAPFSRLVMAVPFVGKDVPSRSSEFAHPDVVIGLTVLAYRYEGLRFTDSRSIVTQLKQDCARQLGPRDTRPAHMLFESWVREEEVPTSPRQKMRRIDSGLEQQAQNILPLSLFQPADARQMARLYKQIRFSPEVSHFWLRQHVFPATMNFHAMKLSASGHELGSSLLFGHRVGFSGTPSNLLPIDLGECFYEPGSDGQVIHVLTNPNVTTAEVCSGDWTPLKLLQQVAQDGKYHALIDTGALITNMDNEQVARELLAFLPADSFDGVVFLDQSDRKMILLRSSTSHHRAIALVTAGVTPERRFTFFDQVHTTGMDILTAPCAKAVVTIGKDMTFRDYAQGAFRMRKVGKGQSIHICVIPEVIARIEADLGTMANGKLVLDVPAWLLLNSCRSESLQSLKLLCQELTNGWRKRALEALIAEVVANAFVGKHPTAERMRRFESGPEVGMRRACLATFRDNIGFRVDDIVTAVKPYLEVLRDQCQEHVAFCVTDEDRRRQQMILDQVAQETQVTDDAEMQYGFTAEVVHEQEAEQQQEQEEEQEEEQENAFTRDDEQANPWNASVLGESPVASGESKTESATDQPFYKLAAFRVRPEQPLLPLSGDLWLTDNFFRPRWVGMGDRKLKNAFVALEWHPELSKERHKIGLKTRMTKYFPEEIAKAGGDANKAAIAALNRAKESVKNDPIIDTEAPNVDVEKFQRHFVMLTLAEAETLRWIIRSKANLVAKCIGFALRTASGRLLDQSLQFVPATPSSKDNEVSGLLCTLRFFNSEMFFQEDQLRALEVQLKDAALPVRQAWFEECLRLRRRRLRHVWMDTPLARLFTPQEEWTGLRSRALHKGIQKALRERARIEDVEVLLQPEWRHDALRNHLLRMRLGFSAGDLLEAVRGFATDGRGMIPAEALEDALQIRSALSSLKELAGLKEAKKAQQEAERLEKASRVWQCQNCTFFNSALSSTCAVCDFGWTGQRECPPDKWCCTPSTGGCTFFNPTTLFYCDVCARARPDLASLSF